MSFPDIGVPRIWFSEEHRLLGRGETDPFMRLLSHHVQGLRPFMQTNETVREMHDKLDELLALLCELDDQHVVVRMYFYGVAPRDFREVLAEIRRLLDTDWAYVTKEELVVEEGEEQEDTTSRIVTALSLEMRSTGGIVSRPNLTRKIHRREKDVTDATKEQIDEALRSVASMPVDVGLTPVERTTKKVD